LPLLPRPVMRALAAPYIAGEELEDALERARELAAQGYSSILDILGEDVADEAAAHKVVEAYVTAAGSLEHEGLDTYVSVKPTHVGLRLSEELALACYRDLARRCGEHGRFVRVEMEDNTTTDATLRLFEALRTEFDNVGLVLQSRLLRTPGDVEALAAGPLDVRLVKGIYLEPAAIAHVAAKDIDEAYYQLARQLFERGARVALATHDERLAERLFGLCQELGVGTARYEMQVLMGVRERLWRAWREAGHPVRVYVPFGPEWRAYSTRRLRKNPQILRHLMRDFFRFGGK